MSRSCSSSLSWETAHIIQGFLGIPGGSCQPCRKPQPSLEGSIPQEHPDPAGLAIPSKKPPSKSGHLVSVSFSVRVLFLKSWCLFSTPSLPHTSHSWLQGSWLCCRVFSRCGFILVSAFSLNCLTSATAPVLICAVLQQGWRREISREIF